MTTDKYLKLANYCDKEAQWLANQGYGTELFDVSDAIRELVAELEGLTEENQELRIELGFCQSWIAVND